MATVIRLSTPFGIIRWSKKMYVYFSGGVRVQVRQVQGQTGIALTERRRGLYYGGTDVFFNNT